MIVASQAGASPLFSPPLAPKIAGSGAFASCRTRLYPLLLHHSPPSATTAPCTSIVVAHEAPFPALRRRSIRAATAELKTNEQCSFLPLLPPPPTPLNPSGPPLRVCCHCLRLPPMHTYHTSVGPTPAASSAPLAQPRTYERGTRAQSKDAGTTRGRG